MNNEIIGLTAMVFVLASFLSNKMRSTRIINIIGAVLFVIYGVLIHSPSTWMLNGVLVLVHIYYLKKRSEETT